MASLTGREIVLDRDEFFSMLADNLDVTSEAIDAMSFVDSAMALQNDAGRPSYVLAIDGSLDEEGIGYLRACFSSLGVAACLVPKGCLEYVATLTPESMGNSGGNIRERLVLIGRC